MSDHNRTAFIVFAPLLVSTPTELDGSTVCSKSLTLAFVVYSLLSVFGLIVLVLSNTSRSFAVATLLHEIHPLLHHLISPLKLYFGFILFLVLTCCGSSPLRESEDYTSVKAVLFAGLFIPSDSPNANYKVIKSTERRDRRHEPNSKRESEGQEGWE